MKQRFKDFFSDKTNRILITVFAVILFVTITAVIIASVFSEKKKPASSTNSDSATAGTATSATITPRPTDVPVVPPEITVPDDEEEPRFSDNSRILLVDVSGMTAAEAKNAVKDYYGSYSLNINLDGTAIVMTSGELGIVFNDKTDFSLMMNLLAENDIAGYETIVNSLISAPDKALIEKNVERVYNRYVHGSDDWVSSDTILVTYPTLKFNKSKGLFETADGTDFTEYNYSKAADAIFDAASVFSTDSVTVTSDKTVTKGKKASESDVIDNALTEANSYLDLNLKVTFNYKDGSSSTMGIDKPTLAYFISYSPDTGSISLNDENISVICSYLADLHNKLGDEQAKFMTHGGSFISLNITAGSELVNTNSLFENFKKLLSSKKSGSITADMIVDTNETGVFDFNGNYVEIDLTNQMVYVYNNYELKVSSPCVTGCVKNGTITPTGVYDIWLIQRDRYLTGPGYKSWVNYFIAFNGGIGFHDASWRSEFGGTNYLYNGSHGCVNMPLEAVTTLYQNIKMGTKVVVYGGTQNLNQSDPVWSGTDTYNVTSTTPSFRLDKKVSSGSLLTYTSDNPSICTVSDNGTVTPKAAGTVKITINCSETGTFRASSTTVTINIKASASQTVKGKSDYSLKVGESVKLDASAATFLSYSSSDSSIVSVDETGYVKALSTGAATITVTASSDVNHQSATLKVRISVTANEQAIIPDATEYTLKPGETKNISVSAKTALSFSSNNENVVTIDNNGNITAIASGEAVITVTAAATGQYNSATITITVTVADDEVPVLPEEPEE